MSITTEQRRLAEAISPVRQRSEDVRFALLLTYITLGWMTIEGAGVAPARLGIEELVARGIRNRQRYRTFQRRSVVVALVS
jgi:hypothetical protein